MNYLNIRKPALASFAAIALSLGSSICYGNENFYPPAPAAKSAIDLDSRGFIINGQRAFISSGSLHYPRVPHELWYDRLLRFKRGGFNTVETYAFWNYNEPRENEYHFTGDGDIGAFLSTAQKLGLYASVRPGPYVCAEWDFGGFPVWLKFKGDIPVRTNDPAYLALNDHWYDKIIPIIAQHQINHGGNVIMVQLENEHPRGWGVIMEEKDVDVDRNAPASEIQEQRASFLKYFKHIEEKATKLGLEVPHFMSGQNHGGNPSPWNLNPREKHFPWITTESWAGWFDAYRSLPTKKYREVDQAQWTILAHGGAGYNFYMLHGGTNFDAWSDSSTGACYDYGASIGQAGDLRPMYYRMKRVNQLAQSFPAILGNADDALDAHREFAKGPGIEIHGARKSDDGTLVFIRNSDSTDATATFKTGETLTVPAYGTYPIPENVVLNETARIASATVPILGLAHNGRITTVIVYGNPGETGRLTLSGSESFKAGKSSPGITNTPGNNQAELKIKFPDQGVEECMLDQSKGSIRILAINRDLSLYTWILGKGNKQYVVLGPSFVQDLLEAKGNIYLKIERPYGQPSCGQVAVYGDKSWHLAVVAHPALDSQPAPTLSPWKMATTGEQAPEYDDSKWMRTPDPQQMGADGDYGCFAWYRATVNLPNKGNGTLHLNGSDDIRVFINGKYVSGDRNIDASFLSGKNTIAVFVSHHGRDKNFVYLGSLAHHEEKGLYGPVSLDLEGRHTDVKGWRMRGGLGSAPAGITSWANLSKTDDLPTFYRATFAAKPPAKVGPNPILRVNFAGLSRGTMWVNGHNLGQFPEKIRIDSLYIPECWFKDGDNELTVFDTHGSDPAKVQLEVEEQASREVILVSQPIDPRTPMVTPHEATTADLPALNKDNLAFRGAVTASGSENDHPASNATDGNAETLWTSPKEKTENAYMAVDLGQPQTIKICEISWQDPSRNYHYNLEGSADGNTWTKLGDETTAVPTSPDSPSDLSRLNLAGDSYRYLRVTNRDPNCTFSIGEIRAFSGSK